MKRFWLSWYQPERLSGFEYHGPWWETGWRGTDGAATICAAVIAASAEAAKEVILATFDERPSDLEWRFIDERSGDWSPFCSRFARGDWMQWPEGDRA